MVGVSVFSEFYVYLVMVLTCSHIIDRLVETMLSYLGMQCVCDKPESPNS